MTIINDSPFVQNRQKMERCLSQTTRGNTGTYNATNASRGSVAQFVRSLSTMSASRFRLARSKFQMFLSLCEY